MNLRKTCKKLGKYLPSNVQDKFSAAYSDMIDSLNEMDVVSVVYAIHTYAILLILNSMIFIYVRMYIS